MNNTFFHNLVLNHLFHQQIQIEESDRYDHPLFKKPFAQPQIMKIYEYRIVIPTTVEKYRIGNLYMMAAKSRQESGQVQGEGVELVQSEPFENEKESGQFTYKIMHFKSRIPRFVRWALPDKYCHCHERSWNAYPHFHTEYNVPGMKDDMIMIVDTQHIPYDPSQPFPDNATGLTEDELKIRKVLWLDLCDSKPKMKKKEVKGFVCPEAEIATPLEGHPKGKCDESEPPHWTTKYNGQMTCAVKVVKFKFKWRGLQNVVEKYVMNTLYHDLFLEAHRDLTLWADKWFPMSLDQVREFEKEMMNQCNALDFERDESAPDEEPPETPPPGISLSASSDLDEGSTGSEKDSDSGKKKKKK